MERVKLHGGPWDGRTIERRWSGTPHMDIAILVQDEHEEPASSRYELHRYARGDHDDSRVWHYHYDCALPVHVSGPGVEDTGR